MATTPDGTALQPDNNPTPVKQNLFPVIPDKPAPYTPAQVTSAVTKSTPTVVSPFSSSSAATIGTSTNAAVDSASKALSTPTTPQQNFTYQGNQFNYSQLPEGMSKSPPPGQASIIVATPFGPVYLASGPATPNATGKDVFGNTLPGANGPISLPTGFQATTPDSNGNVIISNAQGQTVYSGPANAAHLSTSVPAASNVQAALGANTNYQGYNAQVDPSGNVNITDPSGNTAFTLDPTTAADPTAVGNALVQHQSLLSTTSAANQSMQSQIATLTADFNEQDQELTRQADAATAEQLAASGGGLGSNAGSVSAVKARYDQLRQDLKAKYDAAVSTEKSNNTTAIASANKDFANAMTSISSTAQSTAIGIKNTAQQTFLNNAKTFDVSTASIPAGQSLSSLTIGNDGTTGIPSVDALIQQGVTSGMTPEGALGLVQAGVATQNKNNQAQFLGLLQQASYANGWANMTPEQLQASPLYNAYVGMAQSYIPSLASNPDAARALVAGGSIQQQKLAITQTGTPTGAPLTGQGGGPIGTIAEGATSDPAFVIPGTGGLYTQADIDKFATMANAGANVSSLLGSTMGGGTMKQRIMAAINNRATQMNPNGLAVVQNQQMLKGLQVSTNTASRLKSVADSSIKTMDYSLGLLLGDPTTGAKGLVDQVNFGTDIVYNNATGLYSTKVGAGMTKERQATVAKYVQAFNTIVNEYGRILYGGSTGAATDSSRIEAADALNQYLGKYSMTQVLNQVKGEVDARSSAYDSVLAGNAAQILGTTTYDDSGNPIIGAAPDPAPTGTTNSVSGFGWNP